MSDDSPGTGALNAGDSSGGEEQEPKKPSSEILRDELQEALAGLRLSSTRLFFSGLAAGLEIGFSLFLMAVMHSLLHKHDDVVSDVLPDSLKTLLVANMYSFGFILVILGRSELFTEQTSLAVVPVLHRQASVTALMRLWGVVYVANIIGAAGSAGMTAYVGPRLGVIDAEAFGVIAHKIVHHPAHVIFLSGVLAGWLMGLLSWLVAASRDTISQIVIVWLVTAAIGLGHLHHSILGSVEVLASVFSGFHTLGDFVHFLFWATLGNAVGGPVFLALLKYAHARPTEGVE